MGAAASAPAPVGTASPGVAQVLDVDEFGGRVERTELPGGLRVLTETMPGVLSATVGIWGLAIALIWSTAAAADRPSAAPT